MNTLLQGTESARERRSARSCVRLEVCL